MKHQSNKNNPAPARDLKTQLNQLLSVERTKTFIRQNARYVRDDGLSYINVGTNAKTSLGRALSSASSLTYRSDMYGEWMVIDTMILYMSAPEYFPRMEEMRNMTPKSAHTLAEAHGLKLNRDIVNRRYHMARAMWARINTNPLLGELLVAEKMPFAFTVPSSQRPGEVFTPNSMRWVGDAIRNMRKCLMDNVDYTPADLVDDGDELQRQLLNFVAAMDYQSRVENGELDHDQRGVSHESAPVVTQPKARQRRERNREQAPKAPVNDVLANMGDVDTPAPAMVPLLAENAGGMGVAESLDPMVNGCYSATEEQLARAAQVLNAQAELDSYHGESCTDSPL